MVGAASNIYILIRACELQNSMAENKKSFLLYADLIHTVKKMPPEKAGELFITILEYVNDQNPAPNDQLVDLVFEPIRQQLKRDLKAWEQERQQRSEAGKIGMQNRWGKKIKKITKGNAVKSVITDDNKPYQVITNITDTVNDTVNVSVKRDRAFAPPAKEEVCNEMMKTVDDFTAMAQSEMFINFYESKGWLVGKTKMKDWKAAARGWLSRMSQFKNSKGGPANSGPEPNMNGHLKNINSYV